MTGLAVSPGHTVVVGTSKPALIGIPGPASSSTNGSGDDSDEEGWSCDLSAQPTGTPAVRSDGVVYVSLKGIGLIALDPPSGQVWRFSSPADLSSPIVTSDGMVVVGSADQRVHALSPDGELVWSAAVEGAVGVPVAECQGGDLVAATETGRLHRLSHSGQPLGLTVLDSPASHLAVGGHSVFVAGANGNLTAYGQDGSKEWDLPLADRLCGVALGADGRLYASGMTGPRGVIEGPLDVGASARMAFLYAVSSSGRLEWSAVLDDSPTAPMVAGDGTVLVASGGEFVLAARSQVYAFSAGGQPLWTYQAPEAAGFVTDMVPVADEELCLLIGGEARAATKSGPSAYPGHLLVLSTSSGQPETPIESE